MRNNPNNSSLAPSAGKIVSMLIPMCSLIASPTFAESSASIKKPKVRCEIELKDYSGSASIARTRMSEDPLMIGVMLGVGTSKAKFSVFDSHGNLKHDLPANGVRLARIHGGGKGILMLKEATLPGESKQGFVVEGHDLEGNLLWKKNLEPRVGWGGLGQAFLMAGQGDVIADSVDRVIFASGDEVVRPNSWKKEFSHPIMYSILFPDGDLLVSTGDRGEGNSWSALIDLEGKIRWTYPGALMLKTPGAREVQRKPKFLYHWGTDGKSLKLVQLETGKLHWAAISTERKHGIFVVDSSPDGRHLLLFVITNKGKREFVLLNCDDKTEVWRKSRGDRGLELRFGSDGKSILGYSKQWRNPDWRTRRRAGKPSKRALSLKIMDLQLKDLHVIPLGEIETLGESGDQFELAPGSMKVVVQGGILTVIE